MADRPRTDLIALAGLAFAILSTIAAIIVIPEIRHWFGLDSPGPSFTPDAPNLSFATPPPIAPVPTPGRNETDYRRLASPAFRTQLIGTTVTFRGMFLSEWTSADMYRTAGVATQNRVFVNHRSLDYTASNSPLGSSDIATPPFALSIPAAQAASLYNLRRGDPFLVTGSVEQPQTDNSGLRDIVGIHVRATELKPLSTRR